MARNTKMERSPFVLPNELLHFFIGITGPIHHLKGFEALFFPTQLRLVYDFLISHHFFLGFLDSILVTILMPGFFASADSGLARGFSFFLPPGKNPLTTSMMRRFFCE